MPPCRSRRGRQRRWVIFRLTFVHDDVRIELSEKTGLVEAKFQGKSAGN